MHNSLLTVDIACDDHLLHLLNEMCTSRCNSGGSPSIRRKFTLTPVSCLGAHLFSVARGIQAERSSRHFPLDQDQSIPHSAKPALRIGKGQTTDGDGDEYRKGILRCVDSKRRIWMAGSARGEKLSSPIDGAPFGC